MYTYCRNNAFNDLKAFIFKVYLDKNGDRQLPWEFQNVGACFFSSVFLLCNVHWINLKRPSLKINLQLNMYELILKVLDMPHFTRMVKEEYTEKNMHARWDIQTHPLRKRNVYNDLTLNLLSLSTVTGEKDAGQEKQNRYLFNLNCFLPLREFANLSWTDCSAMQNGINTHTAGRSETSSALTNQEITRCFQRQVSLTIKALRSKAGLSAGRQVQKNKWDLISPKRSGDGIGDSEVENGWLR